MTKKQAEQARQYFTERCAVTPETALLTNINKTIGADEQWNVWLYPDGDKNDGHAMHYINLIGTYCTAMGYKSYATFERRMNKLVIAVRVW